MRGSEGSGPWCGRGSDGAAGINPQLVGCWVWGAPASCGCSVQCASFLLSLPLPARILPCSVRCLLLPPLPPPPLLLPTSSHCAAPAVAQQRRRRRQRRRQLPRHLRPRPLRIFHWRDIVVIVATCAAAAIFVVVVVVVVVDIDTTPPPLPPPPLPCRCRRRLALVSSQPALHVGKQHRDVVEARLREHVIRHGVGRLVLPRPSWGD